MNKRNRNTRDIQVLRSQGDQGNPFSPTIAMQVAEILSDLTSLRACPRDRKEALALANVHKTSAAQSESTGDGKQASEKHHAELSRAKELLDLHYGVKVKLMTVTPSFEPAVDEDLRRAMEGARQWFCA